MEVQDHTENQRRENGRRRCDYPAKREAICENGRMGGPVSQRSAWRLKGEQDKAPIQYTDCGLDDVYLVSGYEIEDSHHGKSLSIKNLDELHRAIGCYLASQKKVLSGKELRFLRKQMDLTQAELGKLVGL